MNAKFQWRCAPLFSITDNEQAIRCKNLWVGLFSQHRPFVKLIKWADKKVHHTTPHNTTQYFWHVWKINNWCYEIFLYCSRAWHVAMTWHNMLSWEKESLAFDLVTKRRTVIDVHGRGDVLLQPMTINWKERKEEERRGVEVICIVSEKEVNERKRNLCTMITLCLSITQAQITWLHVEHWATPHTSLSYTYIRIHPHLFIDVDECKMTAW